VTDLASLREAVAGKSVVFHLAGMTKSFSSREFLAINRGGVRNVAQACAEQSTPPILVVVSSLAAAGPAPGGRPRLEADTPCPVSMYGRSKRAGERSAERFADRVPITIVRPPIVFGEADTATFEMFKTVARSGIHPVPGYMPRNYSVIHADDLVEALILAAIQGERLQCGASEDDALAQGYYFASCDEHPTYYKLGRLIGQALGRRRTFSIPFATPVVRAAGVMGELSGRLRGEQAVMNWDKAREALAGSWTCSAQKAQQELGFSVPLPLMDRLRQTADWYRNEGWL